MYFFRYIPTQLTKSHAKTMLFSGPLLPWRVSVSLANGGHRLLNWYICPLLISHDEQDPRKKKKANWLIGLNCLMSWAGKRMKSNGDWPSGVPEMMMCCLNLAGNVFLIPYSCVQSTTVATSLAFSAHYSLRLYLLFEICGYRSH